MHYSFESFVMNAQRIIVGLAVVVLTCVGPVYAATLYSVTDLGDLPGGDDLSNATAINSTSQVVGFSRTAGGTRAFLWENGVMTNLGVLTTGHDWSVATDINDAGKVVGSSMIEATTGSQRPYIYDGTMTDLGSFGGGYGFANGINNSSEVVGLSSDSGGVTQAFLWDSGIMTNLGSLGDPYSNAYDINPHFPFDPVRFGMRFAPSP